MKKIQNQQMSKLFDHSATASSYIAKNSLIRDLNSERSELLKRARSLQPPVMPQIDEKAVTHLRNSHPLRVFEPIAQLFIRKGFTTERSLATSLSGVNSEDYRKEVFLESKSRLQAFVAPRVDPAVFSKTMFLTLNSLFPSSDVPVFRPLSSGTEVVQAMNQNASSGYPEYVKKRSIATRISTFIDDFISGRETLVGKEHLFSIFNRIQPSDKGTFKLRLVFGPSWWLTAVETLFGYLVTAHFRGVNDSSVFIGKRQVEISELIRSFKGYYVYSFDYRKFDQTLPSFWFLVALRIIRSMLALDDRYLREWTSIEEQLGGGPSYHPLTGVFSRKRGVPSGSYFTNLADSIANLAVVWYSLISTSQHREVFRIIVHGDDLLLVTNKPLKINEFVKVVGSFGLELVYDEAGSSVKGVDKAAFLGSL